MFGKFLAAFRLRTATPTFDVGQRIRAYMSHFDPQQRGAIVRVGDTILTVPGEAAEVPAGLVDLEITSFDESTHRGEARRL